MRCIGINAIRYILLGCWLSNVQHYI